MASAITLSLRAAVVATLVAACAAPSLTIAPGGVQLRAQETPTNECMAARMEGTLVRDPRSGLALRQTTGIVEQVIWPFGYSAREEGGRLAVLDATGTVLAYEGDQVAVGGGEIESGTWLACAGTLAP